MPDLVQFFPYITVLGLLVILWRFIGVLDRVIERQQVGTLPTLQPPVPAPIPVPIPAPRPEPVPIPKPAPVPVQSAPIPIPVPVPEPVPTAPPVLASVPRWPADNQAALMAFYGDPAKNEVEPQLVRVAPPFRMTEDGKPVPYLVFHKKAAASLLAALNSVWDYYGHDQAKMDALGITKTAGTYNKRVIAGTTRWSNHAFGAAIDINAAENGFNVVGNIPRAMIAAFKAQGARWGGDYKGRTDPMHFEFCESGEPKQSFEAWLAHYGVSKSEATAAPVSPTGGATVTGKMSTFGGPADTGVAPDEGLALCEPSEMAKFPGYFLAEQPPGTTGLARRLDPNSHYIAMRWDYKQTPRSYLQSIVVKVVANGKSFDARPIDWGPNINTGRICDLSPGLATALGLQTDNACSVTMPAAT